MLSVRFVPSLFSDDRYLISDNGGFGALLGPPTYWGSTLMDHP